MKRYVCEHCASFLNGRITQHHRAKFITEILLDRRPTKCVHFPSSRARKCSECSRKITNAWIKKPMKPNKTWSFRLHERGMRKLLVDIVGGSLIYRCYECGRVFHDSNTAAKHLPHKPRKTQ